MLNDRLPEAPTAALEIDAVTVSAPLMVGSVVAPINPTAPVSVILAELSLLIAIVPVLRLVVGTDPVPSTMDAEENEAEEPTAAAEIPLPVPPEMAPPYTVPVTPTVALLSPVIVVAPAML